MSTELRELALMLQGIIDTATDGIITIDHKGIVESINNAGSKMFGYEEDEVLGNNISMLMPKPYSEQHDGYLERYERTRERRIIGMGREVSGKRKDGSVFPFRLAVGEVILNDRIIYTGIVHDLTDMKNVQADLIQLNNELEQKVIDRTEELSKALSKEKELNELKSRFVSMASHEFRTPLSTILSSAGLIGRYENADDQLKREKHINRIKSSVANLTGILNDFLSLSKLEEGKVAVSQASFNVRALVEQVIEEVGSMKKANQTLNYSLSLDQDELRLDSRILKNILFNLISNALKYSGPESTTNCAVQLLGDNLRIVIQDNGIGIPESDQKYLFERFFRASNVENIQGTGLGLNIVQEYVSLLNGEISFTSREGKGTTFTINIPVY